MGVPRSIYPVIDSNSIAGAVKGLMPNNSIEIIAQYSFFTNAKKRLSSSPIDTSLLSMSATAAETRFFDCFLANKLVLFTAHYKH